MARAGREYTTLLHTTRLKFSPEYMCNGAPTPSPIGTFLICIYYIIVVYSSIVVSKDTKDLKPRNYYRLLSTEATRRNDPTLFGRRFLLSADFHYVIVL